jgi:hypothetical protein
LFVDVNKDVAPSYADLLAVLQDCHMTLRATPPSRLVPSLNK